MERMTKRQEQAQESRKRLMDTALSLFALRGYAATSVHTLCQSAGVADSLLYHYFPGGKGELMDAIARENLRQVMLELSEQNELLDALPLEEMLEALYQHIQRVVMRHEDLFRLMIRERELLQCDRLLRLLSSRQQWFPEVLRRRAQRGEIREMDFESASETLNSLMLYHLIMELMSLEGSPLRDEAQRRRMIAYQAGLWRKNDAPSPAAPAAPQQSAR